MNILVSNLQYLSNHKASIPHTVWSIEALKLHSLLEKGYSPNTEPKIRSIIRQLNKVFTSHDLPNVDIRSNLIEECKSFAIHNGIHCRF